MKKTTHHIEPTPRQVDAARAARDAIVSYGWSVSFYPHEAYGARVALKAGKEQRLGAEARQKFNACKAFLEVLMERGYALQKTQIKQGNAFVDSDATKFARRAMDLFPGSRVQFG